ncbi:MAG: hypothetical protein HY075_13070 [Deltaproteobacteria bacterium]|nr:hypothetical protein [Deltaproteobacteria bacterium]
MPSQAHSRSAGAPSARSRRKAVSQSSLQKATSCEPARGPSVCATVSVAAEPCTTPSPLPAAHSTTPPADQIFSGQRLKQTPAARASTSLWMTKPGRKFSGATPAAST